MDSESLVVKIENKRFLFSVGEFLEVTSQRRHVLGLGPNPLTHSFG